MPATPRFTVSQTDFAVVVCIKVPHIRVGGAETHVDGKEFSFYCKPYLLRLTLPHEVGAEDDDGSCKAVYDPADDNGTITVTLRKATPGLHFPDLDLTTTLMQPRWSPKDLLKERATDADGSPDGAPTFSGVEVLSSEHYDVRDGENDDHERSWPAVVPAAAATEGQTAGATGAVSHPQQAGAEGAAAVGRGSAAAGGGAGGIAPEILIRPPSYGFNDKFSGFFVSLRDELREMIHLPDPDNTPPSARRGLRLEHEEAAFDVDRYLADLYPEDEDPLLTEALAFEPHWQQRLRIQRRQRQRRRRQLRQQEKANQDDHQATQGERGVREQKIGDGENRGPAGGDGGDEGGNAVEAIQPVKSCGKDENASSKGQPDEAGGEEQEEGFTEAEQEQMRRLPNREYIIEPGSLEERRVLLGLADVLFAYAYDHRTTGGDASVESAWTVAVLSPLLSWLEVAPVEEDQGEGGAPPTAADTSASTSAETRVALAGIRRSLIFPYLRVWELGALVTRDVRDILTAGKRCILRCLLQTYAIMERGEVHYLLNKLFIEDYCVWIQKASEESLASFAERYAVAANSVTKAGACLELESIEAKAARLMATDGVEESSEDTGEEETSDGETSDDATSEDESSEEESSGSGEDDDGDETGVAESVQAVKGTLPAPSSTSQVACEADACAPAVAARAAEAGDAGVLGGVKGGRTNSGGGGSEGEGAVSVATSITASGDIDQPSSSRGVARSAELLQLETLATKGEAAEAGSGVSHALASRLAVLNLEKQPTPLRSGGGIVAFGRADGANAPQPQMSTTAAGDEGGVEGTRRRALIEEV
eukprot:g10546.t1